MDRLEREQLEELVHNLAEHQPQLVLQMAAMASEDVAPHVDPPAGDIDLPGPGYHPPPHAEAPDWCVCRHCREMPTAAERVCCGNDPAHCTSTLPQMDRVILDPMVIEIQNRYRNDILAENDIQYEDPNSPYRHGAYRQYILWIYGYLGQGDRRVIPSCVVWRIRDRFPNRYHQYTGFKPSRFM